MGTELTDISQLDPTLVQQAEDLIRAFINDSASGLDIDKGSVLDQLIVRFYGLLSAKLQQDAERWRKSSSLLNIIEDPTLADEDTVDEVISNFLITRRNGTLASGQILLVLDSKEFTSVPSAAVFTANGIDFSPIRTFNGVTDESSALTNSERVIFDIDSDNSQYGLLIDVTANEAGSAGNVSKDTAFTTDIVLTNLVQAIAAEDFDGGSDTETNQDLLNRLPTGIATRNLGTRDSTDALIRSLYTQVKDVSVIGAADVEMLRDKNNLLGISSFGKVDIYVRTRTKPVIKTVTKTGTLQDSSGTWSMSFTRDEIPAAYKIVSVVNKSNNQSATISRVQRLMDNTAISNVDFTPTMENAEHVFTRYQTMLVEFIDTSESTPGTTAEFDVSVLYPPQLDEINDYLLSRPVRPPAGDYLVKGAVPALVSVGVVIVLGPGEEPPDADVLKTVVTDTVNSVDFEENYVSADDIIAAIKPYLSRRTRIKLPIDLRCQIITPDTDIDPREPETSGNLWVFDSYELKAPYRPDLMVTARTVSFFADESRVAIDILASDHLVS